MNDRAVAPIWRRALRSDLAWVLAVGLVSRFEVYALAWLFNHHFDLGRGLANLLCSWDCDWYLGIVKVGYQLQPEGHDAGDAANWAFFPLFPLLTRALALAGG